MSTANKDHINKNLDKEVQESMQDQREIMSAQFSIIYDDKTNLYKRLRITDYVLKSEVKQAIGENEPHYDDDKITQNAQRQRNYLRKEILATLNIGDK